jgi:hypothetical protein
MTAPLVFHISRHERVPASDAVWEIGYSHVWYEWTAEVPGQLWSRVAEGRKQVWS